MKIEHPGCEAICQINPDCIIENNSTRMKLLYPCTPTDDNGLMLSDLCCIGEHGRLYRVVSMRTLFAGPPVYDGGMGTVAAQIGTATWERGDASFTIDWFNRTFGDGFTLHHRDHKRAGVQYAEHLPFIEVCLLAETVLDIVQRSKKTA